MKKISIGIFVLALLILGILKLTLWSKIAVPINTVTYKCDDNKTIDAKFFKGDAKPATTPGLPPTPGGSVQLALSDGRPINLPQTISADGSRYANNDESFIFWSVGDNAFITEGQETTFKNCSLVPTADNNSNQLANPASVNCLKVGGTLKIEKRDDGGQYGLCYFEDNRACEEWALIRNDCPIGGVKTTGFDTIDQKFCAWSGGQTLAVPNSICTFKNGSKCSTKDFYNGTCSPTDNY